jgi:hypothetical protein
MKEFDINSINTSNYKEVIEFEYTQQWLKKNTQIRGWLIFYLVIMTLGTFGSAISSLIYFIWTNNAFIFIPVIAGITFAILSFNAISERKPNALFFTRCYLALTIIVNIQGLLTAVDTISHIIHIAVAIIWICYFYQSDVVEEVIPSEYREVNNKDYIIATIGILATVISLFVI